ncbi:integrase, catalytic region, zinc finger, CCHC-type containing protein [Tanacetum coccineum]
MQLNQEIFQKDSFSDNKNALEIPQYFENNALKAQLQAKDTTICKLKEHIKSMRENDKEEKVKHDMDEIEIINIELEDSVAKLLFENERLHKHLKKIYKDQFDSIKKIRALSMENADLKGQIQEKERIFKSRTKKKDKTKQNKTKARNERNKVKGQPVKENKLERIKNYQTSIVFARGFSDFRGEQGIVMPEGKGWFLYLMVDRDFYVGGLNGPCMWYSAMVISSTFLAKKSQQHNIWKPMGKVFTEVGYKWKPTGRLFTLVGNSCPLTRITSTKVVPIKETTSHSVETQKPDIKVYNRRPKQVKSVGSSKKAKIVESKITNHSEPNHLWGSNTTDVLSSSSLVNDMLSRLFSGLGHNLFSVGQFCDADLEVAFRKNTCFIWNLEGVDLLSGSRDTNLYIISLDDMLKTSLICLLSKASKTMSWLWHRQLSHLNFGTLNKLAKDGLARGIPKLKFKKDHMCSACALGKIKKSSHQPKAEDTNQEKLYLLHMDLCGPMRVESINGKKYILVIVDDYSRFTWVKFMRSKDEAPDAIIKCRSNPYNVLYPKSLPDPSLIQQNSLRADAQQEAGFIISSCLCSGPGLQSMTPATSHSGLVPNPIPQQPFNPPTRNDWDRLFQPMFDENFNPPSSAISPVPVVATPRAVDIAGLPLSTTIDQNAPSSSTSSTNQQQQSSITSQGVEEPIPNAYFDDPCHEPLHDVSTSQESSSNVQSSHSPLELISR